MALQRRSAAILLMLAFMAPVVECARVMAKTKNHFSGSETSGGYLVALQNWESCGNLVPYGLKTLATTWEMLHSMATNKDGGAFSKWVAGYCHNSWRLVKVGKDGESWTDGPLGWSSYSYLPKNSGTYGIIFGVFDNTLLIKENPYLLGPVPPSPSPNVSFHFVTMDGKKKDAMLPDERYLQWFEKREMGEPVPTLEAQMAALHADLNPALLSDSKFSVDNLPQIPGESDGKWSQFGVNGAELVVHINSYPYLGPPNDNEYMAVYTMSNNDEGILSKLATVELEHMEGELPLEYSVTADERHAYVFVQNKQTLYQIPKVPPTSEAVITPSAMRIHAFRIEYMFAKPGSTSTSLLIIGGVSIDHPMNDNGGFFEMFTNKRAVYEATSENLDKPETWKLHISPFDEKVEGFSETNLPQNFQWKFSCGWSCDGHVAGHPPLCVAYDADNQHLYLGCGPITVLDLSPATWTVLKQMKLPTEAEGLEKSHQINSIAWVK